MESVVLAVVVLVSCFTSVVLADTANCEKGEIHPKSPYFVEGDDITLICRKHGSVLGNFRFIGMDRDVDSMYIQRQNDSTILMKYPLSTTVLSQVGISMNFLCKDGEICVRSVYVDVEYALVKPQNIRCWVYNWSRLDCSWSLGAAYKHPEDIDVILEFSYDNSYSNHSVLKYIYNCTQLDKRDKCPRMSKTNNVWVGEQFFLAWRYHLKVTVRNERLNVAVSAKASFIRNQINEPAPVKQISAERHNGCVRVKWKPYSKAYDLHYNLTYQSKCDGSRTEIQVKKYKLLCDLVPNTEYNISVSGQYVEDGTGLGYWSKPNYTVYTTESKVPSKSPSVTTGLYDYVEGDVRNLTIYWEPLNLCEMNSPKEKVFYRIKSDINETWKDGSSYNARVSVGQLPVNITIQATNNVGPACDVTVITVLPSNTAPAPSDLVIEYGQVDGKGPVSLTIVPADRRNDTITLNHTLVMCKGSDFCLEPVRYRNITDELYAVETVSDITRFGLITRDVHGNQPNYTGIQWQKCVYVLGKNPPKPLLKPIQEPQPAEAFRIEWPPQDCKDKMGYIKYYQVFFCPIKEADSHTCSGEVLSEKIDKTSTSFLQADLQAGSHYRVWLRSVGKDESYQGSYSDTVTVTIMGAELSSKWKIILGVSIGVAVILVGVIVAAIVFCCKKCRNNLEDKQQILDILSMADGPSENTRMLDKGRPNALPDNRNSDPSADSGDSGTSSLNTNTTDVSRDTDHLLSDSDSAINVIYQRDDNLGMPEPVESFLHYQESINLSGGTLHSITGMNWDIDGDCEVDASEETEVKEEKVSEETGVLNEGVYGDESRNETDLCPQIGQTADIEANDIVTINNTSSCDNFIKHTDIQTYDASSHVIHSDPKHSGSEMNQEQVHSHIDMQPVDLENIPDHPDTKHSSFEMNNEVEPVQASIDMQTVDLENSPEDMETYPNTLSGASGEFDGYGTGECIDLGDVVEDCNEPENSVHCTASNPTSGSTELLPGSSNSADQLEGYGKPTDIRSEQISVFSNSMSNLSLLSDDDSDEFSDQEILNSAKTIKKTAEMDRPVECENLKHKDVISVDITTTVDVVKLAKKHEENRLHSGYSSSGYHKATVTSSGSTDCNVSIDC